MSAIPLIVRTAAGEQALAEGIIYTHEHLWLDLSSERDPQGKLDRLDWVIEEVRNLKDLGVVAIMELTCLGMGRDVARLRQIQQETGVQVIPATGYYYHMLHPSAIAGASIEQIEEFLVRELREGMDGTGVRPMILGEIGGSGPPLHRDEVKVFKAVARVALDYPVVVTTHAHLGGGGLDELRLLLEGGLAPERVLIGHLDLCPSLDDVIAVARQGAYVGFDTVGKQKYAPDERRASSIKALQELGLIERILLSCDISRNSYLRKNGGQGYDHLLRTFLPMLRAVGITEETISMILTENPRRFLSGARIHKEVHT